MKNCAICDHEVKETNRKNWKNGIEPTCDYCGHYRMLGSDVVCITNMLNNDDSKRFLLSHYVRQRTLKESIPQIHTRWAETVIEQQTLPNPHQQGDYLIEWLGDKAAGSAHDINDNKLLPIIGGENVVYIAQELAKKGYLEFLNNRLARLTFDGWQYYDELQKSPKNSTLAFMAMPFNCAELDDNFNNY